VRAGTCIIAIENHRDDHGINNAPKRKMTMKTLLATAAIVAALTTSATAEIICTERGCWETGARIILVDPSAVRGAPLVSHRNGKRETIRNLGVAESTTPCEHCGRKK
jgi:hypothetical protein